MHLSYGHRLRAALKKNHRSQAWLADKLEVSATQLSRWCSDKRPIPIAHITAICFYLQISTDSLLPKDFLNVSADEQKLLEIYRDIESEENKKMLLIIAEAIAKGKSSRQ